MMLVVEIGFKDEVTKEEAERRLRSVIDHEPHNVSWIITGFGTVPDHKD